MKFFAATAANINDIAAKEALAAGANEQSLRVVPGGVEFEGELEIAYRFSLWSRTASRLLLLLGTGEGVETGEQLYHRAMAVRWFDHISPEITFAVHATVRNCRWLTNSQFGALKVKDAIVDQMREIHDDRPSVDTDDPDIIFHLHQNGTHSLFYLDITGKSLHRRGYRRSSISVSLKEHIAAALLVRAGWMEKAEQQLPLLDPFCGSGTIPIEAALMASDTAPGLLHPESFAFLSWKGHDQALWERLLAEAEERQTSGLRTMPPMFGWDIDERAVQSAASHAENAGMSEYISFDVRDFTKEKSNTVPGAAAGIIVSDPPYGARSGEREAVSGYDQLRKLYHATGEVISEYYPGWNISFICGTPDLLKEVGMKPRHTNILFNGAIQCSVAHYSVFNLEEREELRKKAEERRQERETRPLTPGGEMFASRLRKNRRMLKAFLKRSGVTSYRLYDADMPEYSAAIDIYEGRWVHLQEYAPPETIDPAAAAKRLNDIVDAVNRVTEIPYADIHVKQRRRQKGSNQYTKRNERGDMNIMRENGLRFYVNFTDYIDTGIFLDHRPVRKMIMDACDGKRFLNLYGYTGTATVHAAAGGALSTMTVDASKRYLKWAEKNMECNGFNGMNHQYYAEDCQQWLRENRHMFDVIFLDPPTFSNSKSRRDSFDIQRDHEDLIFSAMYHLEKDGILYFSNNFRKFEMSLNLVAKFKVTNITEESIPEDFTRNHKIHNCWTISYRPKKARNNEETQIQTEPRKVVKKTVVKHKGKRVEPAAGKKSVKVKTVKSVKVVTGAKTVKSTKVVKKRTQDDDLKLDF